MSGHPTVSHCPTGASPIKSLWMSLAAATGSVTVTAAVSVEGAAHTTLVISVLL